MILKIAVIAKSKYFSPYREAMVRALKNWGLECKGFEDFDYSYQPDGFLVIGPHLFPPGSIRQRDRFMFAAVQTEQLPNPGAGGWDFGRIKAKTFEKYRKKYDFILEWHKSTLDMLEKRMDNVFFMPHSCFDEIVYLNPDQEREEDYDLLFIGDPSGVGGRREKILAGLKERFRVYPEHHGLWGRKKAEPLARSKIVLNIHFDDSFCFESPRFYEALANRRFLLSEKAADTHPLREGVDFASCHAHQLVQWVERFLADPEARRKIAGAGWERVRSLHLDQTSDIVVRKFLLCAWRRKSVKPSLARKLLDPAGWRGKGRAPKHKPERE